MRLEQRMMPEMMTITAKEYGLVRDELSSKIFNTSQEKKLGDKYRDYFWQAERLAKRGDLHEHEERYLTSILFYLFPAQQLHLDFEKEKNQFYEAIEKGYGITPEIQIGFGGDANGFKTKSSPLILKQEIKEEHLGIHISDRIKGKIEDTANKALLFLEQEENSFKPSFIVDAYGMVYVTPLYFNERINKKHKERFEREYRDVDIRVSKLE